jgi:Domain of Unknown Function (DUF1080)
MNLLRSATVVSVASLAVLTLAADPKDTPPPVVTPAATFSDGAGAPADAIVLFDGKDLSKWKSENGGEPKWTLAGGAMQVNGGGLMTREEFGDIQLHLEWASPSEVKGDGQGRGNSGVYFQGRYEIQVLDSYQNPTYPNGQASSFYGHSAPLVNASRKPGEWQTYDIVFRAPKPMADGKVQPGSFTVFHNGMLVQDHIPIPGAATTSAKFTGVAPTGPIMLQDHGNPVRYRNIWLRKLAPAPAK